jgi:hypothetical protein
MRSTVWLSMLLLAGCQSDAASPPKKDTDSPAIKLAGVWPDKFDCGSIVTTDVLTQLLGAEVRQTDTPSSIAKGNAKPCTYEVATNPPEQWIYDFDCRDGYKQRADALFEQYKQMTQDRIDSFNRATDAGTAKITNDAGQPIELVKPGVASDVAVGAKALDHNDQGILFIDDDAPCYVRVIGRDPAKRLELAKLVAKNLTFANAPMTPRPVK